MSRRTPRRAKNCDTTLELGETQSQLAQLKLNQEAEMHEVQLELARHELQRKKNPFRDLRMWISMGGVAVTLGTLCVLIWTTSSQSQFDTIKYEQVKLQQMKLEEENKRAQSDNKTLQEQLNAANVQLENALSQKEDVNTQLVRDISTRAQLRTELDKLRTKYETKKAELVVLDKQIQTLEKLRIQVQEAHSRAANLKGGAAGGSDASAFDDGAFGGFDASAFSGGSHGGFDAGAFSGGSFAGRDASAFSDGKVGGSSGGFNGGRYGGSSGGFNGGAESTSHE